MKFPHTATQGKVINPLMAITAHTAADNAQPRASSRFEDNLKQQVSAGGSETSRRSQVREQDNSARTSEPGVRENGSSLPSDEQNLPPAAEQAAGSERQQNAADDASAENRMPGADGIANRQSPSSDLNADGRRAADPEASPPVQEAMVADAATTGDGTDPAEDAVDANPLWKFESTVELASTTTAKEPLPAGVREALPDQAAALNADSALTSSDALPGQGSDGALTTALDAAGAATPAGLLDPLATSSMAATIPQSMTAVDGTQSLYASVSPILSSSAALTSAPASPTPAASDWTAVAAYRLPADDSAVLANTLQPSTDRTLLPGAQSAGLASAVLPANGSGQADDLLSAAHLPGTHDKAVIDSRSAATTASWLESLLGQTVAAARNTVTVNNPAVNANGAELLPVADAAPLPQSSSGTATAPALATSLYSLEQRQLAAAEARQALAQQAPAPGTGAGAGPDSTTRAGALELAFGQTGWADRLGRQLLLQSAQGSSSARIRLDPPELGSLTVRIQLVDQSAAVNFVSPHAMVRDALEQQSARLQDMFREQGMDLLDVSVSDHSADEGNGRQHGGHQSTGASADAGPVAEAGQLPARRVSDALIDYYA